MGSPTERGKGIDDAWRELIDADPPILWETKKAIARAERKSGTGSGSLKIKKRKRKSKPPTPTPQKTRNEAILLKADGPLPAFITERSKRRMKGLRDE